jgi:tetratricopeptide (TPR) repeat protein
MRLKQGRFFLAAKEWERAAVYANQILLASPNSLDGLSLQGEILLAQGKYRDALLSLNRALEIFNQTADTQEEPEHLLELIELAREKRGN